MRWFDAYQDLKHQMIDVLSDADLSHVIEGSPSLGALCREHGEIEQSYLDSFRTYELRFDYKHPDPDIAGSTEALSGWYAKLDEEFKEVLEAVAEEDFETATSDRKGGRCRSLRTWVSTKRPWSSSLPRVGFTYWQWARPCPSSGETGSDRATARLGGSASRPTHPPKATHVGSAPVSVVVLTAPDVPLGAVGRSDRYCPIIRCSALHDWADRPV